MKRFPVYISMACMVFTTSCSTFNKPVKIPPKKFSYRVACPNFSDTKCAPTGPARILYNRTPEVLQLKNGAPIYTDFVGGVISRPHDYGFPTQCGGINAFTLNDIDDESYSSDLNYSYSISEDVNADLKSDLVSIVRSSTFDVERKNDIEAKVEAALARSSKRTFEVSARFIIARLNSDARHRLMTSSSPEMRACRSALRAGYEFGNVDLIEQISVFEIRNSEAISGLQSELTAALSSALGTPMGDDELAQLNAELSRRVNSRIASRVQNTYFVWGGSLLPEKRVKLAPILSSAAERDQFRRTESCQGQSGYDLKLSEDPELFLRLVGTTTRGTADLSDGTAGFAIIDSNGNMVQRLSNVDHTQAKSSRFSVGESTYQIWAPQVHTCWVSYRIAKLAE